MVQKDRLGGSQISTPLACEPEYHLIGQWFHERGSSSQFSQNRLLGQRFQVVDGAPVCVCLPSPDRAVGGNCGILVCARRPHPPPHLLVFFYLDIFIGAVVQGIAFVVLSVTPFLLPIAGSCFLVSTSFF